MKYFTTSIKETDMLTDLYGIGDKDLLIYFYNQSVLIY